MKFEILELSRNVNDTEGEKKRRKFLIFERNDFEFSIRCIRI